MTRDPNRETADDAGAGPPADDASPAGAALRALAQSLSDQLDAARRGRVGDVAALADRVDALIAEVREAGSVLRDADRQRLLDLHGQVRLVLAQQQTELADRRDRLRAGKRGARAYAASGGSRG